MNSTTKRPTPTWLGSAKGQPSPNLGKTFPAEPLTSAEANALIAACSPRSNIGRRNRALLTVLYRAGLRISEALALKVADIDQERGRLRILHGKGNKARVVPIDHGTLAVLQRWIDARKALGVRNGRLFSTLSGGELDSRYVRALLTRLAAQAGIEKRVHPHGLRHTYAVELVQDRVPVTAIQKLLGHADLKVTTVYLDHLTTEELDEFVQRRQWEEPA